MVSIVYLLRKSGPHKTLSTLPIISLIITGATPAVVVNRKAKVYSFQAKRIMNVEVATSPCVLKGKIKYQRIFQEEPHLAADSSISVDWSIKSSLNCPKTHKKVAK